jgi:hypothetical protein
VYDHIYSTRDAQAFGVCSLMSGTILGRILSHCILNNLFCSGLSLFSSGLDIWSGLEV